MNSVFRLHFFLALIFIISGQAIDSVKAEKPSEANPQTQLSNHFFFIQITDTHFDDLDHYEKTRGIVDEINKLPMKIEFVVHTGDITVDKINEKKVVIESLAILNNLKAPIYYIPGNHDILYYDIKKTRQSFNKHFGKLIQRISVHGVTCIFLYTEPLAKSVIVSGYNPFEQLQTILRENKHSPVVIFHHTPSVEGFYLNKKYPGWPEDNRNRWVTMLNDFNVKAVIAGHFHKDEHHWLGNVPLYVSSSVAGYSGRQASYRIYEYNNGKISYRTQYR